MGARSEWQQIAARALGRPVPELTTATSAGWRLVSDSGTGVEVRVRMVDQWTELTASPTDGASLTLSDTWTIVRCNTRLAGAIRLALAPGDVELHLRGDICVGDDNLDSRFSALCEEASSAICTWPDGLGLERFALTSHRVDGRAGRDAAQPPDAEPRSRDAQPLVSLCTDSGWPFIERGSGQVDVPIECGSATYHARLELSEDGALCAVTDLVDAAALSSTARSAVALLLLNTSAIVRSVKGVVACRDGTERAGLAAACERPRSGADLDRALSALTVACGIAGREARALRHEALARDYLACHATAFVDLRNSVEKTQTRNNNQYVMEETPCLQQL